MNSGFRSEPVSDALTRRQLYVERAKTALHDEHDTVTAVLSSTLSLLLGRLSTQQFGSIAKSRLRTLLSEILGHFDTAAEQYLSRTSGWLETYTTDEAVYTKEVLKVATEEEPAEEDNSPLWPAILAGIIGATGLSVAQTLSGLKQTQRNAVRKTLQRAYAQNWSVSQVLTAFRGTVARSFKDGLFSKLKRAAAATVDTVVQFGMSAARIGVFQQYAEWVLGYTWVSILDGRTSATCRSLSGRTFIFGAGPLPPAHYRCRSHIEPVFKSRGVLSRAMGKAADSGETYYQWLKKQPAAFQDDVLGPTRGDAFRNGGLSAEEFAAKVVNARHEPLTLDELRKKYPDVFART